MNVLYCGDENIQDGLFISILSLLKNVPEDLHIYVLTVTLKQDKYNINGISDSVIEFINQKIKEKSENSFIKKIDITDIFSKEILTKNMNTRFNPCCMLRLYADLVYELPEKILYLDYDVICRKDCSEFYYQDMEDYELAGALDYYGKWLFKNKSFKFNYINSGVLLLNLNKIRETGVFQKARQLCRDKKMFMPDQSSINKVATSKKIDQRKYNEQRRLHDDTVFHHFTTSFRLFPLLHTLTVKPWQVDKVHKKLKIYEYDDILDIYTQEVEKMQVEKKEEID